MRRSVACLALAIVLAGCGAKPTIAPVPTGAPKFADFVFPAAPPDLGPKDLLDAHARAWQFLQAGDTKEADRDYASILKIDPAFYPAEAGLGYSAYARKDSQAALAHFDKALTANATYAPALAGKGDALLALGRTDAALEAFQAALAADPGLTALRERVDVLKFRVAQDNIANARKAADAGRLDEARRGYLSAIASSPESAFLYRELAAVERKAGDDESALTHARQAAKLDPSDSRALQTIAEILEARREWTNAADAYAAVNAAESSERFAARIDELREKAAFETMPDEYRAIGDSPTITRAQLAALIGTKLNALVHKADVTPVVVTDTRGNWAAVWIQAVTRAGIMTAFPNHTFQPNGTVRRADLAATVSRVLALIAAEKPKVAGKWRDARVKLADVPPSHLSYPAASRAVAAGVMAPLDGDTFQLARPVTGSEALDAVSKLEALAKK